MADFFISMAIKTQECLENWDIKAIFEIETDVL